MYATRCDLGQTWNGSACVGTRQAPSWNDGTVNWVDTSIDNCSAESPNAIAACNQGKSFSAFLNTADSSTAAGTQPHLAAQACESLNIHGKDDWYLPALGELYVMYQNRSAINNFIYDYSSSYATGYWSSSELGNSVGRRILFQTGYQSHDSSTNKNAVYLVRCARGSTVAWTPTPTPTPTPTDAPTIGPSLIIDNGDAGFSAPGYTTAVGEGFQNDIAYAAAGSGGGVATWTFNGLATGTYRVSATWNILSNRATNSPFTVYNGGTSLGTILVNQELTPADRTDAGVGWKDLGSSFVITGSTLVVKLTDAANEYVIADGIRIQQLGN